MMQRDATSVVKWMHLEGRPEMKEVRKGVFDAPDWTWASHSCFLVPFMDS